MATFSGNPADRATGNVSPGSRAEAGRATSGMSNGTARNSGVGSGGMSGGSGNQGLARDMGDRGFRTSTAGVSAGSMKDQSRIGAAETVNTSAKGGYLGTTADRRSSMSVPKMSTGPVSRGIQTQSMTKPNGVVSTPAPAFKSGYADSQSIVPGKVTMKPETISFGKKNPSMAKYLGGTTAKPVKVSVDTATKMATTVPKVGAYISDAGTLAKRNLPKTSLSQLGVTKKGYGSTVLNVGGMTSITLSYPKVTKTGKSFGTYTSTAPAKAASVKPASTPAPFSKGKGSPAAAKTSTGRYYDTDYKRDVAEAFRKSPETSTTSKTKAPAKSTSTKKTGSANTVVKNGYTYTKNKSGVYTNFKAASSPMKSRSDNKVTLAKLRKERNK